MRKTPKTQPEPSVFRDFVALTKPSITMMCVLMAAGGIGLAPGTISGWELISTLAGIALIVGSANALNMAWEHETDKLMQRTKKRPLPAGRMSVKAAWTFGAMIGMAGLWMLCVGANPQASLIGGLAIFAYVFVYTPMKRVSPLALLIGSFPGAAPPLIGWVAVTGTIDAAGLVLFGIVMLWQIPHFAAITLFRKHDYAQAGIRTTAVVMGDMAAKLEALIYSSLLVPVSLMLVPLGVAGRFYFVVSLALGLMFWAINIKGFMPGAGDRWARSFFKASLVYLPLLTLGLLLDVFLQ